MVLDRLLGHVLLAQALDHHVAGRLARPESRNAHVSRKLADRLLPAPAHDVLGHRHVKADPVVLQRGDLGRK
jgi:hypothetical protein